jgi:hypothetical protein
MVLVELFTIPNWRGVLEMQNLYERRPYQFEMFISCDWRRFNMGWLVPQPLLKKDQMALFENVQLWMTLVIPEWAIPQKIVNKNTIVPWQFWHIFVDIIN